MESVVAPKSIPHEWTVESLKHSTVEDTTKQNLRYSGGESCKIYHGDCLDVIQQNIAKNSIALIVTSPP